MNMNLDKQQNSQAENAAQDMFNQKEVASKILLRFTALEVSNQLGKTKGKSLLTFSIICPHPTLGEHCAESTITHIQRDGRSYKGEQTLQLASLLRLPRYRLSFEPPLSTAILWGRQPRLPNFSFHQAQAWFPPGNCNAPLPPTLPPSPANSADLVADLQVEITGFGVETQVDPVTIVADDVLGSRVLAVPSSHQLLQPGSVTRVVETLSSPILTCMFTPGLAFLSPGEIPTAHQHLPGAVIQPERPLCPCCSPSEVYKGLAFKV